MKGLSDEAIRPVQRRDRSRRLVHIENPGSELSAEHFHCLLQSLVPGEPLPGQLKRAFLESPADVWRIPEGIQSIRQRARVFGQNHQDVAPIDEGRLGCRRFRRDDGQTVRGRNRE